MNVCFRPSPPRSARTTTLKPKPLPRSSAYPAKCCQSTGPPSRLYNRDMHASDALGVNALSRELAHGVLRGAGSRVPCTPLVPGAHRPLDARTPARRVCARLRRTGQASATRALRWLPRIYRIFPLRCVLSARIMRLKPGCKGEKPARSSRPTIASGWASRTPCSRRIES